MPVFPNPPLRSPFHEGDDKIISRPWAKWFQELKIQLANLQIKIETPSGVIDGSNKTFSAANTPTSDEPVQLFQNGVLLKNGVDYTVTGKTIKFTSAPGPGTSLQFRYSHQVALP